MIMETATLLLINSELSSLAEDYAIAANPNGENPEIFRWLWETLKPLTWQVFTDQDLIKVWNMVLSTIEATILSDESVEFESLNYYSNNISRIREEITEIEERVLG